MNITVPSTLNSTLNATDLACDTADDGPLDFLPHVVLNIAVIWLAARTCGWVFERVIRQPRVIGEILAGLLLGPSTFGVDLFNDLFPPKNVDTISVFGTIGLILYSLLIGVNFSYKTMSGKWLKIIGIGLAASLIPGIGGAPIGYWLSRSDSLGFIASGGNTIAFMFILASALATSALPVAAAILQEQKKTNTEFGRTVISASALVTLVMFGLLGIADVVHKGDPLWILPLRLLGVIGIGVFSFIAHHVWKYLIKIEKFEASKMENYTDVIVFITVSATLAGVASNYLGFTYLLGPFIFGVLFPPFRGNIRVTLAIVKRFTMLYLLPIFLAFSGLKTNFRLLKASHLPGIVVIILFGVLSKLSLTFIVRLSGFKWYTAFKTAALLNCRGLLVLIISLKGTEIGLIGDGGVVALVSLAVVSTGMTGPLLLLGDYFAPKTEEKSKMLENVSVDDDDSTNADSGIPTRSDSASDSSSDSDDDDSHSETTTPITSTKLSSKTVADPESSSSSESFKGTITRLQKC